MRFIMPAPAPNLGDLLTTQLQALGTAVRAHRRQLKVSATSAAEAAGLSRVTLHRIERGEPSVTMGAYFSVIAALGLEIELKEPSVAKVIGPKEGLPSSVRLADYPQLKRLAWQRPGVAEVSAAEALSLYERNWRHIDPAGLEPGERALVQALANFLGGGRLLV
jgi:transcriptional regulator with XRE-family HTH domain